MTKGKSGISQKPVIGHMLSVVLYNRWPQRFRKSQIVTGLLMEEANPKRKVSSEHLFITLTSNLSLILMNQICH